MLWKILTLGVSRSLAGFLETWFLAFLHAGIAGEQALFAQSRSPFRIDDLKRAGNAEADSFGLAGCAAAVNDERSHRILPLPDPPRRMGA